MSAGGGPSDGGLDFELNLAPIIDCFTVLITFMLVSATFLSLTTLEAAVTPMTVVASEPGAAPEPDKKPAIKVTVDLKWNGDVEIQATGDEPRTERIAPTPAGRDLPRVMSELRALRAKWPAFEKLTLLAENDVEYQEVVRVMEQVKQAVPTVMLGGF